MLRSRSIVSSGIYGSIFAALALLFVQGCGDDKPSGSSSSASSTSASSTSASSTSGSGGAGGGETTDFRVSGTLSYEYVPYDPSVDGLDYTAITKRPIRGASVRLIDADSSAEIAKTTSDDKGDYSFDYMGVKRVAVWVYSETEAPVITVQDNTSGDEVYVLASADADSAADLKLDVVATTGWDGKTYAKPRAAAPFAVLDAAYTASRRFLDEATPTPDFIPLSLSWSVDNRPEEGDKSQGQIGTSHWDGTSLYILGKEDVDTDEFDSHIIVHEWAHAFQSRISRSDTIGGTHAFGDIVDPRVALGEGFANAMSAIILDPDTVYTDSSGAEQADGFSYDLELNELTPDVSPGWFSEKTVAAITFDLYDGKNEPFDTTELGIQGIYTAMLALKTTPSLTTLFPFVAALKAANPQDTGSIDALVTHHVLDADFGVDAVEDEWGTGETHSGGVAPALPLYVSVTLGSVYTADFVGPNPYNWLAQNRYYKIIGDGLPVTVDSTCAIDIDLNVFHVGESIASAATVSGDESLTFDTVDGEIYVLTVQGTDSAAASYSADISIMH